MAVVPAPSGPTRVVLADGAVVPFPADGAGGYHRDTPRGLSLEVTPSGWTLARGPGQSWDFDPDGRLVGGTRRGGSFTVEWAVGAVSVVEARSGRSVRYLLDPDGRVSTATTSDGRMATYRRGMARTLAAGGPGRAAAPAPPAAPPSDGGRRYGGVSAGGPG